MKTISFVIPATRGDVVFVPELLRALNRGSMLPFEIIVSVSRGGDVPADRLREVEQAFGQVRRGGIVVNREMCLAAGNRNRGAALASGDIVAFFDADDLPHPLLVETVAFMFSNFDIVHLNHCGSTEPLPDGPLGRMRSVHAELLYPLYFPNGRLAECVDLTNTYGGGLPPSFRHVVTGHTYVDRSVLAQVKFRNPWELPFPKAEDYVFCMEVLHRFRKSMIIDATLSMLRPSTERGADRHGYRNIRYVSVDAVPIPDGAA